MPGHAAITSDEEAHALARAVLRALPSAAQMEGWERSVRNAAGEARRAREAYEAWEAWEAERATLPAIAEE